MNIKKLQKIAIYQFKYKFRTRCKFEKIHHYVETEESVTFYGLFRCKRRMLIKRVTISYYGTILDRKSL